MASLAQTHLHHTTFNLFTVFSKIYFDHCSPKNKDICFKTYLLLLPVTALVCMNLLV